MSGSVREAKVIKDGIYKAGEGQGVRQPLWARRLGDALLFVVTALVGVVLFAGSAGAQFGFGQVGSLKRSPADIVKRYVRLDQKGARLDAMGFDVVASYVDWKEEPVWNRLVVIEGAEVPEDYRRWEILDNLEVVIPVTFHVRGEVDLTRAIFTPGERREEIRFRVKAVGNSWRIIEPMIPPHVGLARTLNFVRQAGLEEKDDAQRRLLASLESSLRGVR
ncbi:MAG: hypothetical protein NZM29_06625 [Nitrospira sp.]|nr:hypothetical protein [Nitrospira sp.]